MAKPPDFETSIFINCPVDGNYIPLLRSIVFTVLACGLSPRSALQERDSAAVRLDKIKKLISRCQLGIHDISLTTLDHGSALPRFNMPFELGLDLGAREYGTGHLKSKVILIFDSEQYRYQKFLSDIAGQDISAHHNDAWIMMNKIRDWLNSLRTPQTPPLSAPTVLYEKFQDFLRRLPAICTMTGLDERNLDFNDYLYFATEWIALDA